MNFRKLSEANASMGHRLQSFFNFWARDHSALAQTEARLLAIEARLFLAGCEQLEKSLEVVPSLSHAGPWPVGSVPMPALKGQVEERPAIVRGSGTDTPETPAKPAKRSRGKA